MVMTFVTY